MTAEDMVDVSARRLRPLGHYAGRFASGDGLVRLREVPFVAQVNVRVAPGGPAARNIGGALGVALPLEPNTVSGAGPLTGTGSSAESPTESPTEPPPVSPAALWLGPDEWLVLGPDGSQERLVHQLRAARGDEAGSVVDVSAQRTVIEVSGPRARELLAKGCSLDLHPRAFPPGRCAQTLLARAGVLLLPREAAGPPGPAGPAGLSYWVFVRPSFAEYLAEWLLDARAEYG